MGPVAQPTTDPNYLLSRFAFLDEFSQLFRRDGELSMPPQRILSAGVQRSDTVGYASSWWPDSEVPIDYTDLSKQKIRDSN